MTIQISPLRSNSGINKTAFLKYILLPEILPRLKNLAKSFKRMFYVFVQILGASNLLPPDHPCLNPVNIDKYRVIDAFLIAWNRLSFKKENTVQIIMFMTVFSAYMLTIGLITIFVAGIFLNFGAAHAQYFSEPSVPNIPYNINDDWAFQFLEKVFGGVTTTGVDFWATAETAQKHGGNLWFTALFVGAMRLYSQALAFICVIMILYIVVTAIVNAARTGKPFGEQFDSIWAPLRFGIAFALIVPIAGAGYNGAQMLAFQSAEWGSNLATNIWHRSIDEFMKNLDDQSLVSTAISDNGTKFIRDTFLINLCYYGYASLIEQGKIKKVNGKMASPVETDEDETIVITYGNSQSADFCGSVELPKPVDIPRGYLNANMAGSPYGSLSPSTSNYLPNVIINHFASSARMFLPQTGTAAPSSMGSDVTPNIIKNAFCDRDRSLYELNCNDGLPCNNKIKSWFEGDEGYWKNAYGMDKDTKQFFRSDDYKEAERLFNAWIVMSLRNDAAFGWASAGVFYIRMSGALSSIDDALSKLPRVISLPINMTKLYATPSDLISNEKAIDKCGGLSGEGEICSKYAGASALSEVLRQSNTWMMTAPKSDPEFYSRLGGPVYDATLMLPDGSETVANQTTSLLFDPITSFVKDRVMLRKGGLHPLGEVIDWGKTFMDIASWAFGTSIVFGILGIFFPIFNGMSLFALTIGQFFIVPGFLLMFTVPIIPFMYFTMMVIEWVAAVLEAVIGLPLWVLTFITAEGDLFGKAMEGIKTLFEIMLRPVIIVMSLLVAIIMFSAGVRFFSDVMALYINAFESGIASEGLSWSAQFAAGMGMFVAYVTGVYIMALSCFKLITIIPYHFGRWGFLPEGFGGQQMGLASGIGTGVLGVAGAVATQGTSIVSSGAQGMQGTAYTIRQTKEQFDEWYKEEHKAVTEHNLRASQINKERMEENKARVARGEAEIPYEQYRKPPTRASQSDVAKAYFRNYHDNLFREKKISTLDYLKAKHAGGTYGAPVTPHTSATAAHMPPVTPPAPAPTTPSSPSPGPGAPGGYLPGPGAAGTGSSGGGTGGGSSGGSGSGRSGGGSWKSWNRAKGMSPTATQAKGAMEALGVSGDATLDQAKAAYRKMANKYHPDKNPGNRAAEEKFQEAAAAWDLLQSWFGVK